MNIVVSFIAKWGKDLFYPESDDAVFLTKFTGHPTITKKQLKLAIEKGWNVKVVQKEFHLDEYLKEKTHKSKKNSHK